MPNWEGIEDAATILPRIWLTRAKDGDVWKPLRKIDCKALNESRGESLDVVQRLTPRAIERNTSHRILVHPFDFTYNRKFVLSPVKFRRMYYAFF
jgi:hypothetical protein